MFSQTKKPWFNGLQLLVPTFEKPLSTLTDVGVIIVFQIYEWSWNIEGAKDSTVGHDLQYKAPSSGTMPMIMTEILCDDNYFFDVK